MIDDAMRQFTHELEPRGHRLSRQDVLSDVLELIRLRGESIEIYETGEKQRKPFDAGRARFHFIQDGAFRLDAMAIDTATLVAGDLVLLPKGSAHVLSTVDASDSLPGSSSRPVESRSFAEKPFRVLTGSFQFESASVGSLITGLPDVIHLRADASGTPEWQHAILRFVRLEASEPAPGAALMISRLIDLLVIRSLREWAAKRPAHSGWLRGLGDARLGRALAAMHGDPAREWKLGELAKIATMSRSHFADRFTEVVGEPPLRYLARWRLSLAADLLRNGRARVSEAASVAGYQSDSSFSRAFKACFGYSPGAMRDGGDSNQDMPSR
jgi:AraC-like DNA-binding protein